MHKTEKVVTAWAGAKNTFPSFAQHPPIQFQHPQIYSDPGILTLTTAISSPYPSHTLHGEGL